MMSQPLRDEAHRLNRDEVPRRLRLWQDRIATEQRALEPVRERMDAIRQFAEEYHDLEQQASRCERSIAMARSLVLVLERTLERDAEMDTK